MIPCKQRGSRVSYNEEVALKTTSWRLNWDVFVMKKRLRSLNPTTESSVLSWTSRLRWQKTRRVYLNAELEVCWGVVKLPSSDDGVNVTVLQIWEQLQMSGFLWDSGRKKTEIIDYKWKKKSWYAILLVEEKKKHVSHLGCSFSWVIKAWASQEHVELLPGLSSWLLHIQVALDLRTAAGVQKILKINIKSKITSNKNGTDGLRTWLNEENYS